MKLQLQLQFYLKTQKETNTEKSDCTLADDELWTNQIFILLGLSYYLTVTTI